MCSMIIKIRLKLTEHSASTITSLGDMPIFHMEPLKAEPLKIQLSAT